MSAYCINIKVKDNWFRFHFLFSGMQNDGSTLAEATVNCRLGILYLRRYWEKSMLIRNSKSEIHPYPEEWKIDTTLLAVLGLGLEQTIRYLFENPNDFNAFEDWILEVNDRKLDEEKISAFNEYIRLRQTKDNNTGAFTKVLDEAAMKFWDENGYVILRNVISKEDCEQSIEVICQHIEIDRNDPETWYRPHPSRQGIMVQLFQHPVLEKNRRSPIIRAAYEQLWQRKDLWVNTDRVGFNPPETSHWKFQGPDMHWDVSLVTPIPFGLQGILYLADTAQNQGAFTLVPGFHKRIHDWLDGLSPTINPRNEDMHALGSVPIAANAGDFIIWHHALPHGSSANTSSLPRFVQYINLEPLDAEVIHEWK